MDLTQYYNKDTKTLTLPYTFNEELNNIPEETEIIIFSENLRKKEYSKFNQLVDNLPENLTHLTFGKSFNHSVNNLPKKLTHLTFGEKFNQSVDYLPENLTHLTFGRQTPVRLAHPKIMNIFIIV
jgi:hypothetical protein